MSEFERKKRIAYKENRKKVIIIQIIALAIVFAVAIGSFLIFYQLNKTYYVHYTESGRIDYKVFLKENDYFEEKWLGPDQAYISNLTDTIESDFSYCIQMDADNVYFDYGYEIEAQLIIRDNDSGEALFKPVYSLKPMTTASVKGNAVCIDERVSIRYSDYNDLANAFVTTYELKNISCELILRMNVNAFSQCSEFEENGENSYSFALNIPLLEHTYDIFTTASTPTGENKVLACSGSANQNVFLVVGIVAASLDVILLAAFIIFIYVTRNEDINYSIKVRKLVSSYRSYIQKINNEFDTDGYQVMYVSTFTEMLGIRDTISSPILMYENADQTRTSFVIPTNTKILYLYEIKVDNYDELYAAANEGPKPEEQGNDCEVVVLAENVDEQALKEAMAEPAVDLSKIDYDNDEIPTVTDEPDGVEVIGVVWPEKAQHNKVYRYDPNGESLQEGDTVLVPTKDVAKNKEVIRQAAVAYGNRNVDSSQIKYPLKKIIGVIKRKAEAALTSSVKND